jgi:hypothetical protein
MPRMHELSYACGKAGPFAWKAKRKSVGTPTKKRLRTGNMELAYKYPVTVTVTVAALWRMAIVMVTSWRVMVMQYQDVYIPQVSRRECYV